MILQQIPQPWLLVVNFYLFGAALTFLVTVLLAVVGEIPISKIFIYPWVWPYLLIRRFLLCTKQRA